MGVGGGVLTWSYSSCMSFGLGRRQFLTRLSPVINGLDVQFQCKLFCMHRQMSFGVPAVLLEALCALPGGIGRFLPCRIGANHCRDILFGKIVDMGLHPGLRTLLRLLFSMSSWCFSGILQFW